MDHKRPGLGNGGGEMGSHQIRAEYRRPRSSDDYLPFECVGRMGGAEFGPLEADLATDLSISPWRCHLQVALNPSAQPHGSLRSALESALAAREPIAIPSGSMLYVDFSMEDDGPACHDLAAQVGAYVVGLVPGSRVLSREIVYHQRLAVGVSESNSDAPRLRAVPALEETPTITP